MVGAAKPVIFFMLLGFVVAGTPAFAAEFNIEFHHPRGGVNQCDLVYKSTPPPPKRVDEMLRMAIKTCIAQDDSADILAMAFLDDDALDGTRQYSGALIYRHNLRKIVTEDEEDNARTHSNSFAGYFVRVKERDRPCCVSAIKRYASVDVVYARTPGEREAAKMASSLAKKYGKLGEDVYVDIETGNKSDPASWRPVRGSDGKAISWKFDGATGAVAPGW